MTRPPKSKPERPAVATAPATSAVRAARADPPPPQNVFEQALREFFVEAGDVQGAAGSELDAYRTQGDAGPVPEGAQEYLSFRLASENFGISILTIKEIIKPPLITPVPRTEPVILGILSLRGTVVPVLDLRRRLGLAAKPQDRKTRILIVQMSEGLIGLLVDEVRHVIRLSEQDIEPPPAVFGRIEVEHLQGVGRHEGEMYTLLEVASMLQLDRLLKRRSAEGTRD